jgi:hypothetical protein
MEQNPDEVEYSKMRDLVQRWQQCSELSAARSMIELSKLPVDEQTEWTNFWREINVVLERVVN